MQLNHPHAIERSCSRMRIVVGFLIALLAAVASGIRPGDAADETSPHVSARDAGQRIDDIRVETYGVTQPRVVKQYLALHRGDTLTQAGVDHDYRTLSMLTAFRVRLNIEHGATSSGVVLRWIVLAKWFGTTDHPFYGDQPLTKPIEGFGSVITSRPLDARGLTVSSYTQLALRAQLARVVATQPLWINAARGREGDLIVNYVGARADYRESAPATQEVYSWLQGPEAVYLDHGTNGTQVEFGVRTIRATSNKPTSFNAPSLQDTFFNAGLSTTLEAGLSHECPVPPAQWYPPNCYLQYRVEGFDSIGALGANDIWRAVFADLAEYNRIGASTFVLHGAVNRTGGRIPTSNLYCAYTFGYAKSLCGTDTDLLQAELRFADARPGPLKFILFTETAAYRIRGGNQSFAPSSFTWRGDEGVGIAYRGFRFNLAYGTAGGRITYEVVGQLF